MLLDAFVHVNVGFTSCFSCKSNDDDTEDIELVSVCPLKRRLDPSTGSKTGEEGAELLEEL